MHYHFDRCLDDPKQTGKAAGLRRVIERRCWRRKQRLCGVLTINALYKHNCVMRFHEIERTILKHRWVLKAVYVSHHQYVHRLKPGKITIPCHPGKIHPRTVASILKQAGM
jgi:predicted RNA binding protein YcfA (HicA-like mRNA interferase family)